MEKIINMQVQFPSEWKKSKNEDVQLCLISNDSKEWQNIERSFNITMSSKTITKIERVQNIVLWSEFYRHGLFLDQQRERNEKCLWHGTRTTDPSKIYGNPTGFDPRYSNVGMWGQGTYFAETASYSDGYAFQNGDEKQIFYCRVLLGEFILCPPDNTLRLPPINQNTQQNYDSVMGHTQNTNVYIIYDNKKAYPSYLVTYKDRV